MGNGGTRALAHGTALREYVVEDVPGSGGFGVVYRVRLDIMD